jgi:DNA (cytosine-5)-methyltransferase 1
VDTNGNEVMLSVGSLFTGIGGIDLGLERAGMTVRWQVERDPWCQRVLEKHWPNMPRYKNIEDVGVDLEPVDLICGGFPCQPVSVAAQQKGTDDDRWLWPEFRRVVGLLRPRYVLVENVPGLFTANGGHAFGEVIGDLADLGYDAEWTVLSAADVGAPHLRKRVWIVADSDRDRRHAIHGGGLVSDEKRKHTSSITRRTNQQSRFGCNGGVAHADSEGPQGRESLSQRADQRAVGATGLDDRRIFAGPIGGTWEPEPKLGRVAHGIPKRVDRLRGLGNAVVPQCVEWIGRRIQRTATSKGDRENEN